MKQGLTELVFILDKSGSMSGLEADTIGGYNALLKKQKVADGECIITTALFDNTYELLHDRLDIRAVKPITDKDYVIGGSTALLDAIGRTVNKIINAQKHMAEEFRAEKVLFVIITDGAENASREYTLEKVKGLIERQQKEFAWEFLFLGANIDAVETAGNFGIHANRAQDYHADSQGSAVVYNAVADAALSYRASVAGTQIDDQWGKKIDEDYKGRRKC